MSKKEIITTLTPEQEALIPIYREKWVPIIYSTRPVDRDREIAAINTAYQLSNYPAPEILFYDSPYLILSNVRSAFIFIYQRLVRFLLSHHIKDKADRILRIFRLSDNLVISRCRVC